MKTGVDQSVDLKRFNGVFFEECAEHLTAMEQILLAIDPARPDPEELNALFRAAHSIKGGAGIFGFDDMAAVTHILESLLDRIRSRELPLATHMVDLFLQAGDVISMQLGGHRDGTQVRQDAVAEITRRLHEVAGGAGSGPAESPSAEVACSSRTFRIVFSPEPDLLRRGVRIDGIAAELAQLGEMTVAATLSDSPDLSDFDPEDCITRWEFTLAAAVTRQEILDVFMFVAEESEILIEETAQALPPQEPSPLPSAAPAERSHGGKDSIRVNVAKVDQLINQVGELLITQAMLIQESGGLDPVAFEALHRGMAQLQRNSRDLQQSIT
jgi:two-component system chemotaxis sensor kinase CheA